MDHRCEHKKIYSGMSHKGRSYHRSWRWVCSKCGLLGSDDFYKNFTPWVDAAQYDQVYKENYR